MLRGTQLTLYNHATCIIYSFHRRMMLFVYHYILHGGYTPGRGEGGGAGSGDDALHCVCVRYGLVLSNASS